jgi:serine/threonine-protein kinase
MGRGWSFRPDAERKPTELRDRAALATLDGDFEGASRLLKEWSGEVAGRPDQDRHAFPAMDLAKVYYEMGAVKKADEVAADFLRRMPAWTEPSLTDWTIVFLPYRWRAGSISTADFERGAAAWEGSFRSKWRGAGRRPDADLDWMVWSSRYGSAVETEAEARDAIAKMPREIAPVMVTGRWLPVDLNVGRALVLAGEIERSRPHLERVARSCGAIADPMVFMHGQLYYGMALERAGETQKARAAYEGVLARWGKARPKSVTADKARERLKALGEKERGPGR